MTIPLLDTHAWIWWVDGDDRLEPRIRKKLDAFPEAERPLISDISLWEMAMLVNLGRVALKVSFETWLAAAANPRTVRVLPINGMIAADVVRLPDTFHRDPADRVIVSTSRVHGLPILTKDARIAGSGLARLWKA